MLKQLMSWNHAPWRVLVLLWALVVLMSACDSGPQAANKPAAPAPALARVAPVRSGALVVQRAYFAQVEPLDRAQLAAGASGEVKAVHVRVGSRVKRGDVLVEIDRDLANTQLNEVRASRERAEEERAQLLRDAERIEALGAEVAPQVEAERLRSQIRAIDAQLAQIDASIKGAREQLQRHRVVAPFDAVITQRMINPGAWVSPGVPALELVNDAGVEILVSAPPELLDQVKVGDEAILRQGSQEAKASVAGVVPSLSPRTRTITLRLLPVTPTAWLTPGQAVSAVFSMTYQDDQAVLLPIDAVTQSGAGSRALVVRDDKAVAVDLRILEQTDEAALALALGDGLREGESVIIRGNERIRPGQTIQVQRLDAEAKP